MRSPPPGTAQRRSQVNAGPPRAGNPAHRDPTGDRATTAVASGRSAVDRRERQLLVCEECHALGSSMTPTFRNDRGRLGWHFVDRVVETFGYHRRERRLCGRARAVG